jgi:uncharacterized oligopeptide transporter (OPT) family protein
VTPSAASLPPDPPPTPALDPRDAPPAGDRPEFTLRAVLVGCVVAAFIGAAFPYVVLKLGFGPNISVVAAFLGYMMVALIGKLVGRRGNRYEYNIVQTAGTSAGQQGFMVIVLAAFDLVASKPGNHFTLHLSTMQIFVWLTLAGGLGVLLAVPLRKHYIDEEKLTFADGVAAGETLIVLDQQNRAARQGLWALSIGGVVAALHTWLRDAQTVIWPRLRSFVPENSPFAGAWGNGLPVGFNWSLLGLASGMIVGLRVTLSMGLGMFCAWFIAPPVLHHLGWIQSEEFRENLRWVMWPALGLMVSGGLTALTLKWKLVVNTFKDLRITRQGMTDFPIRWVIMGSLTLAALLVVQQRVSLDLPIWLSILAILISVVLMVVGIRVLGETNWAPISTMANLVQVLFAFLAPGSMAVNMVASGMSGTIAGNGEQLMQDYKAGKLIGSNNRYLTYMQLIAQPIGAMAVALIYPLLRAQNGIGPDRFGLQAQYAASGSSGLSAPASVRWAGFAEVLSTGLDKLPHGALTAFGISLVVGVVLTLLESKYKWVPSVTSVGLGALIEAWVVFTMVVGGVIWAIWHRVHPKSEGEINLPLSSGLIVGEAMISSIILPVLKVLRIL